MPKRVAFITSAAPSAELTAGQADATHVFSRMVDQSLGCCDHSSKLLPACYARKEFTEALENLLKDWNTEDQLIFYFSGHGADINNLYCLKFGENDSEWWPFSNITNSLLMHGVTKGIILLDACYSGKALKSDHSQQFRDKLPDGFAYLVSSGERQRSREAKDGSVSVFTELIRSALDTGLGNTRTSDGMIAIDDLAKYIAEKLRNDPSFKEYAQRPVFDVRKADERIWVSKNKSGGASAAKTTSDGQIIGVHSEAELRLLFEHTSKERRPIPNATVKDLDESLIKLVFLGRKYSTSAGAENVGELAARLGLFADVPVGNSTFLHRASVICFCRDPEKFIPQATSTLIIGNIAGKTFERKEYRGPLSVQFEELFRETMSNLRGLAEIGQSGRREEIDEIPAELVREILSNAFVHRDYWLHGGIQVAIGDSWLDIRSPGEFKNSWEVLLAQNGPVSIPVDPALVLFSKYQKICEQIGRGFEIIREYIKNNGPEFVLHDVLAGPTTCIRIKRPIRHEFSATKLQSNQFPLPSLVQAPEVVSISNIPITVPRDFLGREEALQAIDAGLKHEKGRVAIAALHGLRGVGKTTFRRRLTLNATRLTIARLGGSERKLPTPSGPT